MRYIGMPPRPPYRPADHTCLHPLSMTVVPGARLNDGWHGMALPTFPHVYVCGEVVKPF